MYVSSDVLFAFLSVSLQPPPLFDIIERSSRSSGKTLYFLNLELSGSGTFEALFGTTPIRAPMGMFSISSSVLGRKKECKSENPRSDQRRESLRWRKNLGETGMHIAKVKQAISTKIHMPTIFSR